MSIKELLLVIVGAALANNLVLSGYFGFDSSVLGKNKGCYPQTVAVLLVVCTVLCRLLHGVLDGMGLLYLETILFAIMILLCGMLPGLVLGKEKAPSYAMLVLNTALLGAAFNSSMLSLAETISYALGTALGFWGLLVIFDSLRLKLNNPHVPKALRGMPITVLAAGIISMAIYAF